MSLLDAGKVMFRGTPTIAQGHESKFTQEDGKWILEINGGTVECSDNKVIVLAD